MGVFCGMQYLMMSLQWIVCWLYITFHKVFNTLDYQYCKEKIEINEMKQKGYKLKIGKLSLDMGDKVTALGLPTNEKDLELYFKYVAYQSKFK